MRFSLIAAVAAAAALSGCVATVPGATVPVAPTPAPVIVTPPAPGGAVVVAPMPSTAPVATAPAVKTVDAGSARAVVSAELARRYPGKPVGRMADCIISNATMAEQADLVSMAGTAAASDAIAAIVKKPATGQCIARTVA